MRLSYWKPEENFNPDTVEDSVVREILLTSKEPVGTSVSHAKRLLKLYGGSAWTEHYERDGTLFEVTPIEISGNNSHHKYNHHL